MPAKQKKLKTKIVDEVVSDSEIEEDDGLEKKIEKVMNKVMNSFRKEITTKLKEFEKSMEFTSDKIDEFLEEMKGMRERQDELEKENKELKEKLRDVTNVVEDMEQYMRNRNVQIDGVPEEKDENLKNIVKIIGKKMDIKIEDQEMDAIHRLPTRNAKNTKPIVVQFTTRQKREEIMMNVRKIKLTTKDINKDFEEKIVYVNEHLTVKRKQIMYEARKLKYEKGYKFLWTRNGKIFIRKDERTNVIELKSYDDLNKIV